MFNTAEKPLGTMNIPSYRKYKKKILQRDFCIELTKKEIAHFDALTTEIQMDNYTRDIIASRWN